MRSVYNTGGPGDEAADQTRGAVPPADPSGPGSAERSAEKAASAVGSDRSDTHGWLLTAALSKVGPPSEGKSVRSAPSGEGSSPTWPQWLTEKVRKGRVGLSRGELKVVRGLVQTVENCGRVGILNASRLQPDRVIEAADHGGVILVEAPGLYFVDYGGRVTSENLLPEDRLGLEFASRLVKALRDDYPDAKVVVVGLYDDYNPYSHSTPRGAVSWPFDPDRVREFRESVPGVLEEAGVISPGADRRDHVEFWEADMVSAAHNLIDELTGSGYTIESDGRLDYVNPEVENPEHFRFPLRKENGHLACEVLDLVKVLKSMEILRAANLDREMRLVVALPEYFRKQQDRLWELLRIFGVQYYEYHNVFYPEDALPGEVTRAAQRLLRSARQHGGPHLRPPQPNSVTARG
ncbi:hypothetical protein ACQEU6_31225 [Spirillospora sp. CA-108201]